MKAVSWADTASRPDVVDARSRTSRSTPRGGRLGSQEAIRALSRLTRASARRLLPDGEVEEVAAQMLRPDDLIEVRAGDLISADGLVERGTASVDTASITGESVLVEVEPGAFVHNGRSISTAISS